MALLIQNRVSEIFTNDIHPGAKLGKGIFLDRGLGIVIGETSVIGNNVTIVHNGTLGGIDKVSGDRHLKIGDGVVIRVGTCVLGNIRVRNNAKIGVGSIVLKPVPAGSTVVGNPTRLIGAKATYYETGFPCLSSPLPIHEKNSKSPGDDLWLLTKEEVKITHDLWAKGGNALALLIQNRVSEIFAIDIHPGAKIGKGIFLDHGTGIVDGETSVIGNNVTILHNVTLGGTDKVSGDRHPKIGDGVVIRVGTCVLCNIRVQNNAKIGAESIVL
ncbi:hypothetical protein BUALT_Bualt18G0027400 [Buddleja alternifolia]|uniref:Serine O-acetyltransferase n=1 Tax=Buddleja alternifolia TaxID=168488 RepID=A0AAV6W422_9LAMI|nr:hypothetical protein BUALT_Bualt18G0027400 [Buddleja alternifolia]